MGKTGRPRHPDILTPRQWEVLNLLRQGLTNEQMAERLGITLDGVKFHVSEILTKLGLSSRDEAAAWQPEERPWWASGLAFLGWPLKQLSLPGAAKVASAAVLAAAAGGIVVLVWALVATGGPGRTEPAATDLFPTRTPIPWIDSTPAPTPFPTPDPTELAVRAAVRPCKADDLTAAYLSENGAMMSHFSDYGFGNRSGSACKLDGPPEVRLVDASGNELPTSVTHTKPCPADRFCEERGAVVLEPGLGEVTFREPRPGQAGILLVWRNHDGALDCGSPRAAKVRFSLPDGSAVDATVPQVLTMAPCKGQVSVWGFGPVPEPTQVPAPPPVLAAELLLPQSATAGQPLDFEVKLTNQSTTAPFVFGDLCPNYVVILGSKEAMGRHSLNCRPVAAIPPGETVSFAMKLAIPADTPPGSYPLDWTLEGGSYVIFAGASSAATKTPYSVTVTAP